MPRDISPSTMSPINENCVENFKSISGRIKKQSIYFNIFLVSTFLAKNIECLLSSLLPLLIQQTQ